MKTIDERQTQKKTQQQQQQKIKQRKKRARRGGRDWGGGVGVGRSYSERVRAKLFCCVFKLGFLQLICKPSLIFKANIELASSIILK